MGRWQSRKLSDVATVNYGKGLSKRQRQGGNVPVYGANGVVGYHNTALTEGSTIVIGRKGSAGAVNWSEVACWPIDTTFFIDEFPQFLDPKFLYHFLRSQPLARLQQSAAIPGLNRDVLYSVQIPLPYPDDPARSLTEQRRIVARLEAMLDEVREIRALQTEIEVDAGRLMDSVLAEVFDDLSAKYPSRNLGDGEICEIFPGQHILSKDYRGTPPGVSYITGPADFGPKHPEIARWTEKPKVLCHPGDVLFTVKGSGVGKVNCAPLDSDCAIGRQIMALRPNQDNLLTDYLFYCLLGRFLEFQALKKGVAIPGIRKEDVEAISIPVPSKSLQVTTIQYLESIKREVEEMQNIVDSTLLDQLEQSILSQAFRGEL